MRDQVAIYSHPRSGLHLLSLGLYYLGENFNNNLSYKDLWGGKHLPSYNHYFSIRNFKQNETGLPFNKHILLLRNYITLKSTKLEKHERLPSGLQLSGYVQQIKRFDLLNSPKMVVYYEDLKEKENLFFEIAKFLNIKCRQNINFSKLKAYVYRMYKESGHIISTKTAIEKPIVKQIEKEMIDHLGLTLYEKYLSKYKFNNMETL